MIPGRSFSWMWTVGGNQVADIRVEVEAEKVMLMYCQRRRSNGEWQDVEQPLYITHTTCFFGGTRPWWLCPSCERRVAVVYCRNMNYACRHCHQLSYTSQRESIDDRAARRANRIRKRLGWPVGIFNPNGEKPKGMRWKTYWRLCDEHNAFANVTLIGLAKWVGILK